MMSRLANAVVGHALLLIVRMAQERHEVRRDITSAYESDHALGYA